MDTKLFKPQITQITQINFYKLPPRRSRQNQKSLDVNMKSKMIDFQRLPAARRLSCRCAGQIRGLSPTAIVLPLLRSFIWCVTLPWVRTHGCVMPPLRGFKWLPCNNYELCIMNYELKEVVRVDFNLLKRRYDFDNRLGQKRKSNRATVFPIFPRSQTMTGLY